MGLANALGIAECQFLSMTKPQWTWPFYNYLVTTQQQSMPVYVFGSLYSFRGEALPAIFEWRPTDVAWPDGHEFMHWTNITGLPQGVHGWRILLEVFTGVITWRWEATAIFPPPGPSPSAPESSSSASKIERNLTILNAPGGDDAVLNAVHFDACNSAEGRRKIRRKPINPLPREAR